MFTIYPPSSVWRARDTMGDLYQLHRVADYTGLYSSERSCYASVHYHLSYKAFKSDAC